MAATLWDQPEVDAGKRLRRLRDKALLNSIGDQRYVLHDLLHDEAKRQLMAIVPLKEAHSMLLGRYQAHIQNGLWHTLPNDGYIHQNLIFHLQQAGLEEELHAVLCEETS